MQTCHEGYTYAMSRFLSEVVLGNKYGNGPQQVGSFCAFMLAHDTEAITCLRTLTLLDTAFLQVDSAQLGRSVAFDRDYCCADLLAQVLERATHLEHILIMQPDALFHAQPRFLDMVASLPNLDEITFINGGPLSMQCLSHLKSHPREISLHMARPVRLLKDDNPRDLMALLPLSDSLQTLHLWSSTDMSETLTSEAIWPSVQELSLGGVMALDQLLPVFPNVRTMYFGDCHFSPASFELSDWPKLDEVTAVCPVPLACPVRRLSLRYNVALEPSTIPILEKTSPSILSCFVGWSSLDPCIAQAVPRLKFLELHVKWNDFAQARTLNGDLQSWLLTFVTPFESVPLLGLALHVGVGVIPAGHLHSQKLIGAIATTIRSLQFVGLSIHDSDPDRGKHDEDPTYTWYRRITSAAEGTSSVLKELPEWEGSAAERQLLSSDLP